MKTAIVTGAGGFIGKALTRRLLALGWQVYAVDGWESALGDFGPEEPRRVVCDFAHYEQLADLISAEVDWFIHFAWAGVSGAESRQLPAQAENVRAAAVAFEQARALGSKKFLLAGSSYQHRMEPVEKDGQPVFCRKNLYGLAKGAAVSLLRAASWTGETQFNSVLFTNVFGPGDRSNRSTNSMLRQLLAGKSLDLITGEHLHDWTYIDDATSGILAVLENGIPGEDYYIGGRHLRTFREIVTEVRDIVAPTAELRFGRYDDKAYIDYSQIDLDALYRDTSFVCTADFAESIRKTAQWLQQEEERAKMKMVENGKRGGAMM